MMNRTIVACVLAVMLGSLSIGCSLTSKAPTLTPSAATAVTNGLSALSTILSGKGLCTMATGPCAQIANTQTLIAQDVAGTTWGGLVRTLMTDLYSQLPAAVQNDTIVWASLAAIEVVLATVGA